MSNTNLEVQLFINTFKSIDLKMAENNSYLKQIVEDLGAIKSTLQEHNTRLIIHDQQLSTLQKQIDNNSTSINEQNNKITVLQGFADAIKLHIQSSITIIKYIALPIAAIIIVLSYSNLTMNEVAQLIKYYLGVK
jgi:chromosome segregation ATPase